MGLFATDKKQITLIYNSETSIGKQTYAYTINSKKEIRSIDTSKTKITGTQWTEIAEKLDVEIQDLVDKKHPNFKNLYSEDISLETHDWLKILEENPQLIQPSILIKKEEFYLLKNPTDYLKHMESDSAGVSRNPEK